MKLNHYIVQWNRDRGLLKTFDPQLELKMLSEEAKEFYEADTFEHRLAEYADFVFVKAGTMAKNHSMVGSSLTMFSMERERFVQLMEWAEEIECNMVSLLSAEHTEHVSTGHELKTLDDCLTLALATVIDNNNIKSDEVVGGKVIKSVDQIKPEYKIRELIYAD